MPTKNDASCKKDIIFGGHLKQISVLLILLGLYAYCILRWKIWKIFQMWLNKSLYPNLFDFRIEVENWVLHKTAFYESNSCAQWVEALSEWVPYIILNFQYLFWKMIENLVKTKTYGKMNAHSENSSTHCIARTWVSHLIASCSLSEPLSRFVCWNY